MATFTWSNPAGGGDWNDPTQWISSAPGAPSISDTAIVNNAAGTMTATSPDLGVVSLTSPLLTLQFLPDINAQLANVVGTLTIASGTLTLGPDLTANGGDATGVTPTSAFQVIGTGTIDNSGTIILDQSALSSTTTGQTIEFKPVLKVESGGLVQGIGGTGIRLDRTLFVSAGGSMELHGNSASYSPVLYGGAISNSGTITITDAGTAEITTRLGIAKNAIVNISGVYSTVQLYAGATMTNAGKISIDHGGTLSAPSMLTPSGTISFADGRNNLLQITGQTITLEAQATIENLVTGTTIDFTGFPFNGTETLRATGNTLSVTHSGTIIGSFTIANLSSKLASFSVVDDGNANFFIGGNAIGGVSLISSAAACFAAGTRILTARGETPIESIAPGDLVPTRLARKLRKVIWTGSRRVRPGTHPRPWDVQPVRVRAGAFGDGLPRRDLILSPDHSLFIERTRNLVPVRYLLNGASIAQEEVDAITWHHLELDAHDAVLAEGLAAESYLDTGNRSAFGDAGLVVMHFAPDAMERWAKAGCAPLLTSGPDLVAERQRLRVIAQALGHETTDDPAFRLLDDRRLDVPCFRGGALIEAPLQGLRRVTLASRWSRPAEMDPARDDWRRLGVAVRDIRLDDRPIDDARLMEGWHAPEPGMRWTDGAAVINVAGARRLSFRLVPAGLPYWSSPVGNAVRAVPG